MKRPSLSLLACLASIWRGVVASRPPNILFILTDDQDWHMESLKHMPLLQKDLINEGTLYSNHYCTVALCCPSRVNLWTGKAAHNTNVTDVWAPYGGYPKIVREGINDDYLPHWLQAAG
ncbi:arylsulfatase [Fusarium albosuccineum]|uniref:Arylsulfatase n=1 Tax=Fusarium albosuccineum TaxID=1237068 RepID=A0A8H4PER3_9HYPO|nr:arylsulfatase [Fusarium albosuccineum]